MSRIILTIMLFVFSAGVANASSVIRCCPKQKKSIENTEISPCHEHSKSSTTTPESKSSGCLCAYTCVAKISTGDLNFSESFVNINVIPVMWDNDIFVSLTISPESPPPKA